MNITPPSPSTTTSPQPEINRPPDAFAHAPLEEVSCPLCGTGEGLLLSRQLGRFGVVKCRRCRLVRLSPRLTPAAARALYNAEYYAHGGYANYVATFERFRALYEKLFAARLKLLSRHVRRPGRLLECGCAHGFQLAWLRNRGWDVVGNELSDDAAAFARERFGLEVVTGPLEEVPLDAGGYDAIYLLDLVEHLYDADAAFANVRRALTPGGVILVQVPFELYHWEKLAQAAWEKKRPATIAPDAVPYHVMFFTPRTLRLMLARGGFRVRARYSGNYGAIRGRLAPPAIRGASATETLARFLYYRMGARAALRALAKWLGQGSGIIYVAEAARR